MQEETRDLKKSSDSEAGQFRSMVNRIRLTMGTTALGANFRRYGSSFSTYEYDAFIKKAKTFFQEALDSSDPKYTVIEMANGRIGIDYNGEIRGIYTKRGKVLAFFRPDYHQAGFKNRKEEIDDFRKSHGGKIWVSDN